MPRPNEQIGPYTLIRQLGRGGFGVVWLAERRGALATTKVALKLLIDDEPDLKAIQQESQLWASVGGHPNVLPIIEADIYDGQVVIASEYAPDGSLDGWVKDRGGAAPSLESAISITIGILAGLEHLHNKKIIHRDLKPANILLQGETPRLADFGLARVLKSSAHSGGIAGTPAYMSPEAFDGKRSEQSDLWSVGVIFYQLISGTLPFPAKDTVTLLRSIIMSEPIPLSPSIPEPLRQIVNYSLRKEPQTRYSSAAEMRAALRTATALISGLNSLPSSLPLTPISSSNPVLQSPIKEQSAFPRLFSPSKTSSDATMTNVALNQQLPELKPDRPKLGIKLVEKQEPKFLESLPSLTPSSIFPNLSSIEPTIEDLELPENFELPSVQATQALTFNLVTLLGNGKVKERKSAQVHYFTEDLSNGQTMDLVYIPGAVFAMGSPFSEAKREACEGPLHKVSVPGFYMSKYLITQAEWALVASWPQIYRHMTPQPSYYQGDPLLPVEQVSWEDTIEFCARLSARTGREYRLPSEAEWEYAARAGQNTPFAFGDTITPDIVNYNGNFPYGNAPRGVFRNRTTSVGTLGIANAFGLYDMHGNVYEWCQDIWHDSYDGAPIDGTAWETGGDASRRVLRGGSWNHQGHQCRCAARLKSSTSVRSPFFGFRVVVSAAQS